MARASWLGKQLKGYVDSQIPTWANLGNNPMSAGHGKTHLLDKPAFSVNFIYVGEDCIVQSAEHLNPFTVKPKYVEA
jgi:hypothetical protein